MITRLLILATETHTAEGGGFGLDFNILETNLINLAILIGVIIYFGRKTLVKILSERRTKIADAIQEAQAKQKAAGQALAEQQEKLAQTQAQAEKIRQSAEERAARTRADIAAKTEEDIERMRETAAKDLSAEQERVMSELKQRIIAMAIDRAQEQLTAQLDDSAQQQIINRSIARLGEG